MSTHEVNLFMKTFQTYESHGIVQQFLHIFQWISQSTQAPDTIGKMSWIAACALRMLARLWYSFRAGDEVPDDDDADEEEDEFTDFSLSWVVRSGWVIKACPSTPSSEAKATSSGIRVWGVGACGEAGDCSSGFLSSTSFSTVKAIGTGACGELEAASCSSGFLSSKVSLWSWGCSSGFLSSKASLWSSNAGHGDRDADAVRARFCSDFRSHCSNLAWASPVHPPLAPTTSWKPRWMLQICIWIRRAVMEGAICNLPDNNFRFWRGIRLLPCVGLRFQLQDHLFAWHQNGSSTHIHGSGGATYRAKVQDTWSHVHFRRQDRKLPKTGISAHSVHWLFMLLLGPSLWM